MVFCLLLPFSRHFALAFRAGARISCSCHACSSTGSSNSEQQFNEDLTMTCFLQVIGSEPEYSSCHGRVIATLDYIWYSETSYGPASSSSSEARSPADKANSESRSPEGSRHAGSSTARLAELHNGDSQSQRGILLQCIPCFLAACK